MNAAEILDALAKSDGGTMLQRGRRMNAAEIAFVTVFPAAPHSFNGAAA